MPRRSAVRPSFPNASLRKLCAGTGYALWRTQAENVKACLADILGHDNQNCILPSELEARAAKLTDQHSGLLFTSEEIESFAHLTDKLGESAWKPEDFKTINL